MALTLADSDQMIQAAIAKAEELQVKLSITICDTGNLIAFSRINEAARLVGVRVCRVEVVVVSSALY
jgi:uncharacterized protein GlcG (DUF336 family)